MSANLKHLLLALALCVGMIGLSGPGAGKTCASAAQQECGCCPMEDEATCCGAAEDLIPAEVPMIPAASAQQQTFQAVLVARPILFLLPVVAAIDFPQAPVRPSLSSAGASVQALLCVRTV